MVFQGGFEGVFSVLWGFQGDFKGVPREFQGCLVGVSRGFQRSLEGVLMGF